MDENTIGIDHIPTVIERERCGKHRAEKTVPCFSVWTSAGKLLPGVCNTRAIRAGFNAPVSDKSLRINSTKR